MPAFPVGTGVLDLAVAGTFGGNGLDAGSRCDDDAEPLAEGRGAKGRDRPGVLEAGEAEPLWVLDRAAFWPLAAGVLARDVDVELACEIAFASLASLAFPNQSLNSFASSPSRVFAFAFARSCRISSIVRVSRLFTLSLMSVGACARRCRMDIVFFPSAD